jgi:hypothetical protein
VYSPHEQALIQMETVPEVFEYIGHNNPTIVALPKRRRGSEDCCCVCDGRLFTETFFVPVMFSFFDATAFELLLYYLLITLPRTYPMSPCLLFECTWAHALDRAIISISKPSKTSIANQ